MYLRVTWLYLSLEVLYSFALVGWDWLNFRQNNSAKFELRLTRKAMPPEV